MSSPADRPLRVVQWVRIRWWNACAYYAVSLAEALSRRGHRSFLLSPPGTPARREAEALGLPVPDTGDPGSPDPVEWVRANLRLRRFLRRERIDLVNVHSGPGHAQLALFCRELGIPLVRTRADIRPPRAGPVQRWLYRRGTTHHLVSADFLRGAYAVLGVSDDRVTTLRGGIATDRLEQVSRRLARQEVRARLGLPPSALLIGIVARLSPVKGHRHLLNAMARLSGNWPELHLAVVGPDAQLDREDLGEMVRALGLGPRVHLVGVVEDPHTWAAALDVAVIASVDSEAVCRSAFEYLGLGIPLVASRLHAIAEVVAEGTGLLVPPGDPEKIADAVGRLLASPELRESLSRAGREHVRRHYSLERFGEAADRLFVDLARRVGRLPGGPAA